MPKAVNGTVFTLTFAGPVDTNTKTYTARTSLTPTASITSSVTPTPGTSTVTFGITNSVAATIIAITLVSTLNPASTIVIPANSWTTSGSSTSFSANLNSGAYTLKVSTSPNGYILFSNRLDVQFPTGVTTTSGAISFNGGTFTITGNNLSPASYITVNNLRGDIVSHTASAVKYHVPALVTSNTQSTFALAEDGLIDKTKLTVISDMVGAANTPQDAIDGDVSTFYSSTNAQCWLGVDTGAGVAIAVSRIRMFPTLAWDNVVMKILYSTFEGSNDMSTWT